MLLPLIILTWNFQNIERQLEEMNHCRALIWIFFVSAMTASAQRQSWATCWRLVAKQKWKTLICIIALLYYSKQKFLRVTITCDMTLSVCASLRGLCARVAIPYKYGLQITRSPNVLYLSYSRSLSFLCFFFQVLPLKFLPVNRCSCKCKSGLNKNRKDIR